MITAEIILDTRRKTKKGYPVKIRIYDTNTKKHDYISLKIYQDNDKLKPDNLIKQREFELIKELEFVNSRNMNLKESLNIFLSGIPITDIDRRILELEAELAKLKALQSPAMFGDFTVKFLDEKVKRKEQVRQFKTAVMWFKEYIKPKEDIALNDITFDLIKGFQLHISEWLAPASVNSYIDRLNAIFNDAQRRETLNIKSSNPFKHLKELKSHNKINKSISIDTLKSLKNIDLTEWKHIKKSDYLRAIHLFLFQIAIGGHDLVDIALLKWTDINKNRISFKRYKNRQLNNGGPTIDNKLFDFALFVIEKYGTKDNERIFGFIPFPDYSTEFSEYKSFQQNYNRKLTKIKEKYDFNEDILSKRARYTFNTIAGNLLINRDIIEELQGHSQSSISHGYYGGTFNEIKDAEHLKVIEAVFEG